jgi:hypothetical protein
VDIENENATDQVEVAVQAEVENGTLKVWIGSPNEEQISAQASPGEPALLGGVAEVDWDEFTVYIQSVEGKAEGVSYEIAYRIP